MKFKILILTLILITLFGCSEKKDQTEAMNKGANAEAKSSVSDFIKLKMDYNVGTKYNYNISTLNESLQLVDNNQQSNKVSLNFKLQCEPTSKDTSGDIDFKVKYLSVKLTAESPNNPNGNISFDSEQKSDQTKINDPIFTQYTALLNNEFSLRLNSKGEIIEIYRTDNIIKKILGENEKKVDDRVKEKLKYDLAAQLKTLTQQIFQLLPDHPVKKDSIWLKIYRENVGPLEAINTAKYTLTNIENSTAKISAVLSTETIGKSDFEEKGVIYKMDKPNIDGKGTTEFDINKGIVLKRELNTTVNTSMSITKGAKKAKVISKSTNIVSVNFIN